MRRLVHRKSKKRRETAKYPQKMYITKGDTVRVISGDHKGREGKVIKVLPKIGDVVIEGVNVVKRHKAPTQSSEGGIIEFPAPLDASNVMLLDPKSSEPTRVRRKKDKDGTVERLSVRSGQPIPRSQ